MLTRPTDLTDVAVRAAVEDGWGVDAISLVYRPVGFGSHHWELRDAAGVRWFATVDRLGVAPDASRRRLEAAYRCAVHVRNTGCESVIAPVPTMTGALLVALEADYAMALFPFVVGQSFAWDDFSTPHHRSEVLDLLVAVHRASHPEGTVVVDDFVIPHRRLLERSSAPDGPGPYSAAAGSLLAAHRDAIGRALDRYDRLGSSNDVPQTPWVVTHGEPHPGNTMRTDAGWVLVDWDTALIAPPERDLWWLDAADDAMPEQYESATGYRPRRWMLDRYRLGWDLADLGVYARRFAGPHGDSDDDRKSWSEMQRLVNRLSD
ncbi:MAG: phosphotransferase [Acidimicrobiia bacterium]